MLKAIPDSSTGRCPPLALRASSIERNGIRAVWEIASTAENVIHLEIGDPDMETPAHIVDAAHHAWRHGKTRYAPAAGIPELRAAAAASLRRHGVDVRAGEVLVTQGSTQGIFLALAVCASPGKRILVPEIAWPAYRAMATLADLEVTAYSPQWFETGPGPDIVEPRPEGAAAIVVNSPSNPTGSVMSSPGMRNLVDFAVEHDIFVLSDECYDEMCFAGCHVSPLAFDRERCLAAYSLSKTYAMSGWRIGYLVVPPDIAAVAERAQEAMLACVSTPTQWAGLAALTGPQDCVAQMRQVYLSRAKLAASVLRAAGIPAEVPAGALYLWLDISPFHLTADACSDVLLRAHQVAVAPGSVFGPKGARYLRLSLTVDEDDLRLGAARIAQLVREPN